MGSSSNEIFRFCKRLYLKRHLRVAKNEFSKADIHPISKVFGFDRGKPLDRYYIESYLSQHTELIQGRVLEVGDSGYTVKYGGNKVTEAEVLNVEGGSKRVTIVGDLEHGSGLNVKQFDCIVLTQVLPFIYDVRKAVTNVFLLLRSGGAVLATVPGISQISRYDMDRWGDYWRFTSASVKRLFAEKFGVNNIHLQVYGNVVTACAFLQGRAAEELPSDILDYKDPDYELLIAVVARKS